MAGMAGMAVMAVMAVAHGKVSRLEFGTRRRDQDPNKQAAGSTPEALNQTRSALNHQKLHQMPP